MGKVINNFEQNDTWQFQLKLHLETMKKKKWSNTQLAFIIVYRPSSVMHCSLPLGLKLMRNHFLSCSFGLQLVNSLHKSTLVLEGISLRLHVHLMVDMPIDLLQFPVLAEQAAQHPQLPHPHHLRWQPGLSCSLALPLPWMPPFCFPFEGAPCTASWVCLAWFLDDETILYQLSYVCPCMHARNALWSFDCFKSNVNFFFFS